MWCFGQGGRGGGRAFPARRHRWWGQLCAEGFESSRADYRELWRVPPAARAQSFFGGRTILFIILAVFPGFCLGGLNRSYGCGDGRNARGLDTCRDGDGGDALGRLKACGGGQDDGSADLLERRGGGRDLHGCGRRGDVRGTGSDLHRTDVAAGLGQRSDDGRSDGFDALNGGGGYGFLRSARGLLGLNDDGFGYFLEGAVGVGIAVDVAAAIVVGIVVVDGSGDGRAHRWRIVIAPGVGGNHGGSGLKGGTADFVLRRGGEDDIAAAGVGAVRFAGDDDRSRQRVATAFAGDGGMENGFVAPDGRRIAGAGLAVVVVAAIVVIVIAVVVMAMIVAIVVAGTAIPADAEVDCQRRLDVDRRGDVDRLRNVYGLRFGVGLRDDEGLDGGRGDVLGLRNAGFIFEGRLGLSVGVIGWCGNVGLRLGGGILRGIGGLRILSLAGGVGGVLRLLGVDLGLGTVGILTIVGIVAVLVGGIGGAADQNGGTGRGSDGDAQNAEKGGAFHNRPFRWVMVLVKAAVLNSQVIPRL